MPVGEVLAREGGGTLEISYRLRTSIQPKDITDITYTADTALEDAYLFVQIPDGAFTMPSLDDDTQFIPLTLTDGKMANFQELEMIRVLQPVKLRRSPSQEILHKRFLIVIGCWYCL